MHITVDLMKHECPCSIRKMNYYKTLLLPGQIGREKNLEKVFYELAKNQLSLIENDK